MNKKGSIHFSEEERSTLLSLIFQGKNREEIAKQLNKSKASITYELRENRVLKENNKSRNSCGRQKDCEVQYLCENCFNGFCKFCSFKKCNLNCDKYSLEPKCKRVTRFPLICNGCQEFKTCKMNKLIYEPTEAHKKSQNKLIKSRSHYQFSTIEIAKINAFAEPLIKSGIAPEIIVNQINNDENMPKISLTTFYRFINERAFSFVNIDLKRKVRYRPRKKSQKAIIIKNLDFKIGRYYENFLAEITENPNKNIWELDTVEGTKGTSAIMTLLQRRTNLMLLFKITSICSDQINWVFDKIKRFIGSDIFRSTFEIILTDNGKEFVCPQIIESDAFTGERLIKLFFCEPRHSEQKGKIEKNHEHFREIIPKGVCMDNITQDQLNLVSLHVNSYPRKLLNMESPLKVSLLTTNKKVLLLNRLENTLPINKIILKPELLKNFEN